MSILGQTRVIALRVGIGAKAEVGPGIQRSNVVLVFVGLVAPQ